MENLFQNGGMAVIRIVLGVNGKNSLEFIDNMVAGIIQMTQLCSQKLRLYPDNYCK